MPAMKGGAALAKAFPCLRALLLFTVLTVFLTWPLAAHLTVMDAGDSAFFAWEIGWELHALGTDPAQLPHANIFHPLRYTLGLDEPVLGTTLLVLPFAPFTSDAVLLFNLARLLTFLASALTARALARELGASEGPALLAGAAFAFSPIRTDQIAHALLAGLFFVLTFLACGYHGLIALAVLPPALLVLLWGRGPRFPAALLAAALAGLALLPLYLMHRAALGPERFARGQEETTFYSAALESFLATNPWNRVYGEATDAFRTIGPNNLFPGLVLPGLVVAGAVVLARRRERPSRDAVALAVLALAAVVVALGPRFRAFGADLGPAPFGLLREAVPLFQMIRVPSRAGAFLALALAILAALALTRLGLRPLAVAGVFVLALAETLIVPIPLPEWTRIVDSRRDPPEVYRWLAAQPGRDPVVELPMLDVYGLERRPAYHESVYMVSSTHHWKPLVNGYAGIEPASYQRIRALAHRFPTEEFLAAIRAAGVRYVVLHRGGYGPNQWARIEEALPRFAGGALREVAFFAGDTVFELAPAPAAAHQR